MPNKLVETSKTFGLESSFKDFSWGFFSLGIEV